MHTHADLVAGAAAFARFGLAADLAAYCAPCTFFSRLTILSKLPSPTTFPRLMMTFRHVFNEYTFLYFASAGTAPSHSLDERVMTMILPSLIAFSTRAKV